MASLSPCLPFWVKLPLLVRDRHDLLLWKLALITMWFDPLITARGVLGEPTSLDARASELRLAERS